MAKNTATFGITDTAPGTERLAYRLMWAWARLMIEGQRPIDAKLASAEFRGMAKAANAMGYGMTETHVEMTVGDIMRHRPQPPYSAMNSGPRIAWEKEATAALTEALEEIK